MNPLRVRVLYASSNPDRTHPLRCAEESSDLFDELARTSSFRMVPAPELRFESLQRTLRREAPHILHLCAHGTAAGGEVLLASTNPSGYRAVAPTEMTDLVASVSTSLRLVVLNCCFSSELAGALVRKVDVAIGIESPVTDAAARAFTRALYQGLAQGDSVATAFEAARAMVKAEMPDEGRFVLVEREPDLAATVRFTFWLLESTRGLALTFSIVLGLTAVAHTLVRGAVDVTEGFWPLYFAALAPFALWLHPRSRAAVFTWVTARWVVPWGASVMAGVASVGWVLVWDFAPAAWTCDFLDTPAPMADAADWTRACGPTPYAEDWTSAMSARVSLVSRRDAIGRLVLDGSFARRDAVRARARQWCPPKPAAGRDAQIVVTGGCLDSERLAIEAEIVLCQTEAGQGWRPLDVTFEADDPRSSTTFRCRP